MLLKRIKLSNFKNFDEAEVTLGKMNVLVGANASGKSNFLQALKFIKDIEEYGIENAISLQGGAGYLKNIHSSKRIVSLALDFLPRGGRFLEAEGSRNKLLIDYDKICYKIDISIKGDKKHKIKNEEITFFFNLKEVETSSDGEIKFESDQSLLKNSVKIKNQRGKVFVEPSIKSKEVKISTRDGITSSIAIEEFNPVPSAMLNAINENNENVTSDTSLLEHRYFFIPIWNIDYPIYDFDVKLPKKAIPISGKAELEENGENVAIILKKILDDTEQRRRFINLVNDILPFIQNVEVERFYDKSLLFKIQESFHQKDIPSSLLSDGTIAVTMMIVALFFERKQFLILEEPEHGIHPALIAKLMKLFYEASEDKQILITTHSSEIVRYTEPKDLLLITRQHDGSSIVKRPDDSKEVHAFLDNELGMDELFTQDLLDF